MNGPEPSRHFFRLALAVCLVACFWLAVPSPIRAATPADARVAAVATAAPFADEGWGWRKFLGSTRSRERTIQIAVLCMCFGLFILMRK